MKYVRSGRASSGASTGPGSAHPATSWWWTGVGANHLFRLVSAAYETRSLVLTSNWAFEQWTNFLPDITTASAIRDHILHHREVLVLNGDSYRLKEAKGKLLRGRTTPPSSR
ncbi:MAG: ATP-binding protein [Candidatus Dormibacteraeota bacterium]|nr:ATP-binding protein [Candidatus Dormibacteraeota bacterium]